MRQGHALRFTAYDSRLDLQSSRSSWPQCLGIREPQDDADRVLVDDTERSRRDPTSGWYSRDGPDADASAARRLISFLTAPVPARTRILVEQVRWLVAGLLFRGSTVLDQTIASVIDIERGGSVIDHKSSPRPRSEWADEALEHSGQLAAYASILRGAGLECAECWVHFPVSGGLVQVVLNRETNSDDRPRATSLPTAP